MLNLQLFPLDTTAAVCFLVKINKKFDIDMSSDQKTIHG